MNTPKMTGACAHTRSTIGVRPGSLACSPGCSSSMSFLPRSSLTMFVTVICDSLERAASSLRVI